MRLTAYKKAIDECANLPEEIKMPKSAKDGGGILVRIIIADIIMTKARRDEELFNSELLELLQYTRKQKAPSH